MRRFYVDREALSSDPPSLKGPDAKHLKTVLRVQPGDEIVLFDETGWEYRSRILSATPRVVQVSVVEKRRSVAESPVRIAIGQAMLKGRKMDRVVRQLTELGVVAFFPFFADRSVSRPDNKRLTERKSRWEKIAKESLKQCGRFKSPQIGAPVPLQTFLETRLSYEQKLIFHCEAAAQEAESPLFLNDKAASVIALIGPEGGFTDQEMALAQDHGFTPVAVGPRILKADTAALAIATILQFQVGDLGGLARFEGGKSP